MANTFNTADFLRGAYYSPITVGKHQITLGKIKRVIDTKEDGTDASYLLVPLIFSNGRTVDNRFYGIGAKIFCDQMRQQIEDNADYDKLTEYLKSLEGKEVNVWISKRIYTANDGTLKSTLQYDFVEPVETTAPQEANDTEEPHPFG